MRSHGVPSLPDPTSDPHAFKEALDPTTEQSPAFGSAMTACHHLLPGGRSQPAHAAQSGADRRAAGVRPLPAQPRVPELPRPEQRRRHNPRDARQRRDRPASAGGRAGRRRVHQRHPRASHQGRRGPLRRGTLDRTVANLSRRRPPLAAGNETAIVSPPSGRACAFSSAPCALAIACTIDSPRPWPSLCRVRAAPSRSNGWNRRSISSGGTAGPEFATDTNACRSRVPVVISTWPPGVLWRIALSIRLVIRRSSSRGSPGVGAGFERRANVEVQVRDLRLVREHRSEVSAARSSRSRRSSPAWPRVRASKRVDQLLEVLLGRRARARALFAATRSLRRGWRARPRSGRAGASAARAARARRWRRTGAAPR